MEFQRVQCAVLPLHDPLGKVVSPPPRSSYAVQGEYLHSSTSSCSLGKDAPQPYRLVNTARNDGGSLGEEKVVSGLSQAG